VWVRIATIFGTRPEVIKLAPVIRALEARPSRFSSLVVCSGQHTDLLQPFLTRLGLRIDRDLKVMRPDQGPSGVVARVLEALDPILLEERPDALLVQGDTSTALAGALAGFHRKIPVGHVEAGLRSGDPASPFPEEMTRLLISRLASFHFAATARNVATLRMEGVDPSRIALTGNPVVDALGDVLAREHPGSAVRSLLDSEGNRRLLVLTTHRRESLGGPMMAYLKVLRRFVEQRDDVALVFPVHPNPQVREAATTVLRGVPRVHLLSPLDHADFLHLLSRAWLVVSDSGGVQEEVATLGRPLLVLRENTERPEAIDSGIARLVGSSAARLEEMLIEAEQQGSWLERVRGIPNPFGDGRSGPRIVRALDEFLTGGLFTEAWQGGARA
jgi:UDP-N-acetylglucosamine 2-epimerase (non-hydrolysing)